MSHNRLRKNLPLISWLAKGKPSLCRAIIKEADRDLVNAICECAHNLVEGNVSLTPAQKLKLKPHKKKLLLLVDKKAAISKKKKVLQRGGFLGALATVAAPAAIAMLSEMARQTDHP